MRSFAAANGRWAGLGPYYAMFPSSFADEVVLRYTSCGDSVIDPFAGRGTVVFSAFTHHRHGVGIEINPVGFVYMKTKVAPASPKNVTKRLEELGALAQGFKSEAEELPEFFHHCFSVTVRQFLLAARNELRWRTSNVDRTLMALLLVYLHGKRGSALSNQMRQAKSMSPDYAVRWWRENQSSPPDVDPVSFMKKRICWRYAKGTPTGAKSFSYLGDSTKLLGKVSSLVKTGAIGKARLLLTSPPYFSVTNYHYDQWIRLWLLGGLPSARREGAAKGGKFEDRTGYRRLLERIFARSKGLLAEDATVYIRTDARKFTRETTISVLQKIFPEKVISEVERPLSGPTQTQLYRSDTKSSGEVDLILSNA